MISSNRSNGASRNLRPVQIKTFGECTVVHVGEMEIWDGAEFALIRETLWRLVEEEDCHLLGVDMRYVKYVPSGFFGLLYDWHDKGVCVRVLGPLPHVRQMLWFTTFFHNVADDFYELRPGPGLEDELGEPLSKCAPAQEPLAADASCLTVQQERTLDVCVEDDEISDQSITKLQLCNTLQDDLSRK